jgi:hypothetical protein
MLSGELKGYEQVQVPQVPFDNFESMVGRMANIFSSYDRRFMEIIVYVKPGGGYLASVGLISRYQERETRVDTSGNNEVDGGIMKKEITDKQENRVGRPFSDCTDMLPIEAVNKGFTLEWVGGKVDPVFLYDRRDRQVFRWDYVPSMGEVWEKIKKLRI